jgi:2'-5' RNA ligase
VGYVTTKNGRAQTVRLSDDAALADIADLYSLLGGDFNGTPSVESEQLKAMLADLQAGKPLSGDEWEQFSAIQRRHAADLAKFRASPENAAQGFVPAPTTGAGRVVEAMWLLPRSLREAEAPGSTGAMVALYPDPDVAGKLAQPGGLAADDLHLTLAFLGPAAGIADADKLRNAVGAWASRTAPMTGTVSGVGHFTSSNSDPTTYASADVPALPGARQDLVDRLGSAGFPPSSLHGFTPHISLTTAADSKVSVDNLPLRFDHVALKLGDERWDFPLSGMGDRRPMTLAEAARVREGKAPPPPNLRQAAPHDEATELTSATPVRECGTCKMFQWGQCWGFGNIPVDDDWVCDVWTQDPDWKAQNKAWDTAMEPMAMSESRALGLLPPSARARLREVDPPEGPASRLDAPTVCVDFDGVVHEGPHGLPGLVEGDMVDGAAQGLKALSAKHKVVLLTARTDFGAVRRWLEQHGVSQYVDEVTNVKPAASAYIDDRALHFTDWPSAVKAVDPAVAVTVKQVAKPIPVADPMTESSSYKTASTTAADKAATAPHLLDTVLHDLAHANQHVQRLFAPDVKGSAQSRAFNAEHAANHLESAQEHARKLDAHLGKAASDPAVHRAERAALNGMREADLRTLGVIG